MNINNLLEYSHTKENINLINKVRKKGGDYLSKEIVAVLPNYKYMCNILEIDICGGRQKTYQLSKLEKFMTFHRLGNSIIVENINIDDGGSEYIIRFINKMGREELKNYIYKYHRKDFYKQCKELNKTITTIPKLIKSCNYAKRNFNGMDFIGEEDGYKKDFMRRLHSSPRRMVEKFLIELESEGAIERHNVTMVIKNQGKSDMTHSKADSRQLKTIEEFKELARIDIEAKNIYHKSGNREYFVNNLAKKLMSINVSGNIDFEGFYPAFEIGSSKRTINKMMKGIEITPLDERLFKHITLIKKRYFEMLFKRLVDKQLSIEAGDPKTDKFFYRLDGDYIENVGILINKYIG